MKLTRRALLASTGAAAAAAALPTSPAHALPTEAPPPLPAALKPDIFRERQAKLRAGASLRNLDAFIVTPSTNLAYTANLSIGRSERLTALLLLTDGPALLVTPSFEEANHKRDAVVDDVKTWPEDGDPIALVGKLLSGRKAIGIEGLTVYSTASLLAAATAARFEDATPVFDELRMVKSEDSRTIWSRSLGSSDMRKSGDTGTGVCPGIVVAR